MEPLDFSEIAELLNHSRTTRIEKTPAKQDPQHWALYAGEYKIHTSRVPFDVLYLHSKATKESIETASRTAFKPNHTQVVFAPSLDERTKVHHTIFQGKAKGLWNSREYLASFIKDETDTYLKKINSLETKFYIDPRVKTPSGFAKKIPNPLLSLLTDKDLGAGIVEGAVGILLAEPGQGKTYMSQHLASTLSNKGFIPIYIDSTQWSSIPRDDLGSLAKTITHSFRHFESTIGWIEGCEDKFLRATLKAGLFRIIFDGFDEYVQWNRGKFSAQEVIDNIAQLAASTGSRILVTSRTSFWNSDLPAEESHIENSPAPVFFYEILPFDQQHARNYFNNRFHGNDEQVSNAVTTYLKLREHDEKLIGRGFVLNLIADLASRAETILPSQLSGVSTLEWIIQKVCEREQLRQKLPLNSNEQIAALRTLIAEAATGIDATTELFTLAIGVSSSNLPQEDIKDSAHKMRFHPLLRYEEGKDRWSPLEEQVRFVLLADHLLTLTSAEGNERNLKALSDFLDKAALKELGSDLASMIVDLTRGRDQTTAEDVLRRTIRTIISATEQSIQMHQYSSGRGVAVAIALMAVDRFLPRGSSHQDRAKLFLSMFPGSQLRSLPFYGVLGTISRMDFSGVNFSHCRFEAVVWANCKFDDQTTFENCHFSGGSIMHCSGIGNAQWNGGTTDQEAAIWINGARIGAGRRAYTRDDLQADIRVLLNKFVVKGGIGFRTIEATHLKTGSISNSKHRDEIISELCSGVLEEHEISGVSTKGFHVRDDAKEAVRFYAANNVLTGPIQKAFDRLAQKLRLT
ncbi:NACHT domain-containing protein [Pyxidicoccus sp. 3LG]